MSSVDASTPASPAEVAPKPNSFQRILGVIIAPGETLASIARQPDWVVIALVTVVVGVAAAAVMVPHIDFESTYREAFEKQNMPSDAMAKALRLSVAFAKTLTYSSGLLTIVWWAILAGILYLGVRMIGGEGTYLQAWSVTLYAAVPLLVKSLVTAGVALARHSVTAPELPALVRSNPAFLVDPKSQMVLFSALSSLDVFTIWWIVLLIIGFAALSRMSKAATAALVIIVWLIGVVIKLGFAAIGAARMRS
jgi:hypothetical protein